LVILYQLLYQTFPQTIGLRVARHLLFQLFELFICGGSFRFRASICRGIVGTPKRKQNKETEDGKGFQLHGRKAK
jgi:hypothetical protein